ncbi:MAG: O-antigen ligase family protein [Bacteroidia bacterium]|nr:O-antigen ligase family protein [Bacteroidia bacterium]
MDEAVLEYSLYLITAGLATGALLQGVSNRAKGWYIAIIGIPLAAEIAYGDFFTPTFPTDLVAALSALALLGYLAFYPSRLISIWKSPLMRLVLLYFAWMGVTTLSSVDFRVSVKFFISQLTYFMAFGVGGFLWARQPRSLPLEKLYFTFLLVPASLVLFLCTYQHLALGGSKEMVEKAVYPFMREHTVYGTYAVWFFLACLSLWRLQPSIGGTVLLGLIGLAVFLSYSRGAWLSLLLTLGLWGLLHLLRRLSTFQRTLVVAGSLGAGVWLGLAALSENPYALQFRAQLELGEAGRHLASSFDLRQNLSNLERINRWDAALSMVAERPWYGFGPNTYAKEYSAYQRSLMRTPVSVEMGEVGGAHSEFLTAASEMGLPGLFLLAAIYFLTLRLGLGGIWHSAEPHLQARYALLTLPLLAYYLHGFINNFMDHGHIAGLVYLHWGLLAGYKEQMA